MSKLDKAIEQVLFENNIPNEWSSEINNELDQLKSETNSSRADLTDKPFITIAVSYTHLRAHETV